jgi:hypothetical protein
MTGTASESDEQQVLYVSSAHIRATGGASDAELLKLIEKKAPDPTIFTEKTPFAWQAEASSGRLDSYFTRMDDRSLRNYAKDADAGVMFLDSHDKRQLGFGQSVRGVFTAADGKIDEKQPSDKDVSTVLIDFYTIPGIQLGRASSDSFIDGVRSGVIHDVSICFIPEAFECNLCRNDPFDWWSMECMHVPGAYYDSTGKNVVTSKSQGAIQAFAWVRNARLSEVSAVYDGATPGAFIKKANFLAEAGEVSRATATILERQLRIKLPAQAMRVPVLKSRDGKLFLERGDEILIDGVHYSEGMEIMPKQARHLNRAEDDADEAPPVDDGTDEQQPSPPSENSNLKREESPEGIAATSGGITSPAHADPEELRMTPEQERALEQAKGDADMVARVRRALASAGVKDAETVDLAEAVTQLAATITDLTPRAKLGDGWRERVIKDAIEQGVRAEGNDFDADGWTKTFERLTVDQVERMGQGWARIAGSTLPNGRKTTDTNNDPPPDGDPHKNGVVVFDQYATRR